MIKLKAWNVKKSIRITFRISKKHLNEFIEICLKFQNWWAMFLLMFSNNINGILLIKYLLETIENITCKVSGPSMLSCDHKKKSSRTPLFSICSGRKPAAYKNSVAPRTGRTFSQNVALEHLILWNFDSSGFAIRLSRYLHNMLIQSWTYKWCINVWMLLKTSLFMWSLNCTFTSKLKMFWYEYNFKAKCNESKHKKSTRTKRT